MYNILTLNKIAACGTSLFDKSKYSLGTDISDPKAVMVRSASMHEFALNDGLRAIARAGAGTNNIPVEKCSEKGIVVFNTPGANANGVKELVLAGLFLSSRRVPAALDWAKTLKGKGDDVPALVEKGKGDFTGPEIKGKKLGVIGLGAIGAMVANAAASLGMEIYGCDPYLSVDGALSLSRKLHYVKNPREIYENCDYISLHAPSTADTKKMINAESIATMKKNVRILNFARADLVDDDAVIAALKGGGMACYVTDFPTDALIGVEGVIAIPHLGASTPESEDNCAIMAANQLIDYLENGNITNSVNLPNLTMQMTGDAKICVIHKNVDGVITQITKVMADAKANIENMESKSKKDYAYTVLDVRGYERGLAAKVEAIDTVVSVRAIRRV
ncbi:MAG: 3-phosphoglycerate dehydrogenase [Oscillospiraceae bacterium]|jgi:D-3-phosphoglycerate dehydrogenase|nr:3-phosphoglycerate dehydrogenase [Oscillospiraceae bacterium]